jgi:hypothetical protein
MLKFFKEFWTMAEAANCLAAVGGDEYKHDHARWQREMANG